MCVCVCVCVCVREAWLRWVKKPILKAQYQQLKTQSRKAADEAREAWWEAKAEEAERLHEAAVRHGRGGSLLKDLRLLGAEAQSEHSLASS